MILFLDARRLPHSNSTSKIGGMKKDKFIKREAKRTGVTVERFERFHDVAPCNCGDPGCPGWRAVYKTTGRGRGEA